MPRTYQHTSISAEKSQPLPAASLRSGSYFTPALTQVLWEAQQEIGYSVDLNRSQNEAQPHNLEELVGRAAAKLGLELSSYERDEVIRYLEQDERPFGLLQPLVDDPMVSDIIVAGYSHIVVQQNRRNIRTDLTFPSQATYEIFVEKLLQRTGTSYSTKKPIADAAYQGQARLHAVHRCLCADGPYLTIRINRFAQVNTAALTAKGLAPAVLMDYLKALVRSGRTILVVGEVGTGKTTLARALAAEIDPTESILVIEDTPEIILDHPEVRYLRTREANSDEAGRISPAQCIRGGMRMAMNRIIFGEMRDAEAAEAFIDVCASGHPGISTIHARSAAEALVRLELFLGRAQRGAAPDVILRQIATAVQVLVHVQVCPLSGRRRIFDVRELGPVAEGVLRQKQLFHYQPKQDLPRWQLVNRVSNYREDLEQAPQPLSLAGLPSVLELDDCTALREAATDTSKGAICWNC